MEWSESQKYNSFNSMKGLTYYEHYNKILTWMDDKGELPPPVECNLDPFAGCNLGCYFCISQRYLRVSEGTVIKSVLPSDYMYRLVDFLADWKVKGLCISGGGEPLLHKDVPRVLMHAQAKNLKTSVFTNATIMNFHIVDALLGCQFVTLSVNASSSSTFLQIERRDKFEEVLQNLGILAEERRKSNSDVFLCLRCLILPENYTELYALCKLAKEIGLSGFSVRPVDFERSDIEGYKKLDLPVKYIQHQLAMCHKLENRDFKVFTVTHKFDDAYHVKHDFTECLATPLLIPILQDGNAYVCVDRKMEKDYVLGSCFPDPEKTLTWWGGDQHRQVIKNVDITRCSRCTFAQYNRQMTEVVKEDRMMLSFP